MNFFEARVERQQCNYDYLPIYYESEKKERKTID